MLKIIKTISEWQALRAQMTSQHMRIGCVPTMGNLHKGHMSLINRSMTENDFTVVTIFVNPTQFNNPDDLKKYPRTMANDVVLLQAADVDYLFAPQIADMYPMDYRYQIHESKLSTLQEGAKRPGHFDGVLSIVMKLFQLVRPTHAYFGKKDFQQLSLITDMVKAFFMSVTIVPCDIVRDKEGLALSSRNRQLSEAGIVLAQKFARLLQENKEITEVQQAVIDLGVTVEYIEDYEGRRCAAVFIEGVRLIDNVEMSDVYNCNEV